MSPGCSCLCMQRDKCACTRVRAELNDLKVLTRGVYILLLPPCGLCAATVLFSSLSCTLPSRGSAAIFRLPPISSLAIMQCHALFAVGFGDQQPDPRLPGHAYDYCYPKHPNIGSVAGRLKDSSKSGSSSSVADRIASLSGSGSGKSSILPPSPSGRPAGSSASPAAGETSQGEGEVSAPAEPPAASKLSPGLAARMNAMRSSTDSVPEGEEGEEEEETPPPPPALATSGSSSSSSKVSPGLAARMGKAFPIPMPGGGMPAGGVAELKRRKQEKEQAKRAAAGMPEEPKPSETAVEQKPGELQH
ncbi:unnamed protein product, partial [Ectocarpus sp. 12 AP-2014]